MKKEQTPDPETSNEATSTIDSVLEQFELLRIWHKTAYVAAIVMICCMIGFIVWGILFEPLRGMLIAFGVVIGICGTVMFVMMHRIFVKTSAAILDYYRATGMTEPEIQQKARELKIKIPKTAKNTDNK